MQTHSYPDTYALGGDLNVNRMGFGAMRITGEGVWGPPTDRAEAIRVLQRAIELGVNFIDTADSYGPNVSEELIAEALHPYPDGLVIATKGGFMRSGPGVWTINADPDYLDRALDGSLQRLKLDRIDLYQLHRVDPNVPFERSLQLLQRAQEDGRIKHIGLSEVSTAQIETARRYVDVVSIQNKYSIDFRKWDEELEYCRQHGIAFIPWYPLAGGRTELLARLEAMALQRGVTVQQLALAWLLHRAENILLIPGTSRTKHLEENVRAASVRLTEEDMAALEQLEI